LTEPGEDDPAAMDELSAHLDRGWDLLEKGDLATATVAARKVLELDAESPEAHTLLGAIAAAGGEHETALEHYDRAMELDPEFVDPLLYAAESHFAALGQFDEAIRLCDAALDIAEEEDEFLDALLLKAEAELAKGDDVAARKTLGDLPPTDLPDPHFHVRAGRALLDAGDTDAAEKHFQQALKGEPDATLAADATHALGLVHEERGDMRKMVKAFRQVREADLKQPAPPWGVTRERFEELAEAALAELPERIRKLVENVPIIASDYPSIELVAEGSDPRMMGFFSGVPYPDKATHGAVPHLDCVFLYQSNIERFCRSAEEVEEEIRKTLLHETGHFFGLSEEELEAMGLG
jgi:tetratricopeptide (TPR) repeat protein